MYLFHVSGFVALRPIISVSTAAIKILAKDTAIFVPIAVPCLCFFLWNVSYALHTILIPSSCGMLVYKLATSIETGIVSFATCVFSIMFKKSVVSLRYDFCILAIG